jgi:hypothetical protein
MRRRRIAGRPSAVSGRRKEMLDFCAEKGKREEEDRTFEIEFLDPGVQAFAFTFG